MSHTTVTTLPPEVEAGLRNGSLLPYLGSGMLALCEGYTPPADPVSLAGVLSSKVSVPGKIRNRLTATAQFIENFKHRKTLVNAMNEAFGTLVNLSPLHRWLAALHSPLIVDTWYDDTMRTALSAANGPTGWVEAQGLSQSEHFGTWIGWYHADGTPCPDAPSSGTVLYKPWGGHRPASNYLISDSDYVEVLTEIDIQTPIPEPVQQLRSTRGFVFLGCRFNDQLPRAFARQILKRSAGPHYAVLAEEPTRMEARLLEELNIIRIALPLATVAEQLSASTALTA